jgi:hypothetical protein
MAGIADSLIKKWKPLNFGGFFVGFSAKNEKKRLSSGTKPFIIHQAEAKKRCENKSIGL